MGCLISCFKKLFQRIKTPKRDRWIRDDKSTLLPVVIDPKKRPNYGAIPKRIERQVIAQFATQDLSRRLPKDEAGINIYDHIHQQLMGTMFLQQTESSDSVVGAAGNQEIKSSLSSPVGERKNESDNQVPILDSSGSSWRDMGEESEVGTENADADMMEEFSLVFSRIPEDDLDIQQLIAEFRQNMTEEAGQQPDEEDLADVSPPHQLERYRVVVHSFDSGDASWIKWVGS